MQIYIFFYLCLALFTFNEKIFKPAKVRNVFMFFLYVFLCTGYMVGSDWRQYESEFNKVTSLEEVLLDPKEYGYNIMMFALKKVGVDFWIIWVFLKIICLHYSLKLIRKYSKSCICLLYFYCYFAIDYFLDNPMRNLIASVVIFIMITDYDKFDFKRKLLFVFVALQFHLSTILVAPLLLKKQEHISMKKIVIMVFVVFFVMQQLWTHGLADLIYSYIQMSEHLTGRAFTYFEDKPSGITAGILFQFILFSVAKYYDNKASLKEKAPNWMSNFAFYYILFLIVGAYMPILYRLTMFFGLSFIIYVSKVLVKNKYVLLKCATMFFLLIVLVTRLTMSYKFIPYTSYLEYLLEEKPSFDERDDYNKLNSPYK